MFLCPTVMSSVRYTTSGISEFEEGVSKHGSEKNKPEARINMNHSFNYQLIGEGKCHRTNANKDIGVDKKVNKLQRQMHGCKIVKGER